MKAAPLYRSFEAHAGFDPILVHTGQHFDPAMSDSFLRELEIPSPQAHLEVGPGSLAWQMGQIMQRLEAVYAQKCPDITVVVGDVSSTLAAALVSTTLGVPVAHVEAGLRSHNWQMPEEVNRVLTDRLSRWLFTPSPDADENLIAEGIEASRIHNVGNIMIDSLEWMLARISHEEIVKSFGVSPREFGLVTLHRASNVDDLETFRRLVAALNRVADELPLLFPVHPRTGQRLADNSVKLGHNVRLLPPLPYRDFVALMSTSAIILTDSGGIQEEAVVLGTPCLTLRDETERPSTLAGSNEVVGTDEDAIVGAALRRLGAGRQVPFRPPLWDGHTAGRIIDVLATTTSS